MVGAHPPSQSGGALRPLPGDDPALDGGPRRGGAAGLGVRPAGAGHLAGDPGPRSYLDIRASARPSMMCPSPWAVLGMLGTVLLRSRSYQGSAVLDSFLPASPPRASGGSMTGTDSCTSAKCSEPEGSPSSPGAGARRRPDSSRRPAEGADETPSSVGASGPRGP